MSKLPPDTGPPPELGLPGVESASVDADGRTIVVFNPIQAKVQWPGVRATSTTFDGLDTPEKFYEQAIAFLHAAEILCAAAGNRGAKDGYVTWSQGSVCYYCIHIATELFLKACIAKRSGEVPKTHEMRRLYGNYAELLPQKEFQFQVPIAWLQAASSFENLLDRAPDQLYRYGVGKDGKGSSFAHQFAPDNVFNRVIHYLRVWPRAWNEARNRA